MAVEAPSKSRRRTVMPHGDILWAMNRRDLLIGATAPLFIPRRVFGANDRPVFGIIGTGNRGGYLHTAFMKRGAHCAAVCDTYEPYMERARKISPAGCKTYADYHELIERKDLDFVVVATPDHQHRPMLFAALKAGKDVYLEKPFSMNRAQSAEMVAEVRKTDRIVQVGMQRRSMPFIYNAKKLIDDGALGKVWNARAAWNWNFIEWLGTSPLEGKLDWDRFLGDAPKRPLDPKRFRWWRGFWDYSGGNMTDQGTHLMDVVQWMTGNSSPQAAVCSGAVSRAVLAEAPDVFTAVFNYPSMMATWSLCYTSAYDFDWSVTFQGEKATMVLDRKGYKIYKEPVPSEAPWSAGPADTVIAEMADTDPGDLHQQNFLDCIKSRKQPNCTVEIAAAAVAGPHMANIAYREGRRVTA
jgi:predicted dehydrogenase